MKIILVSSEVFPFAKTGGLADVVGALPRELEKLEHEVSVFMPGYRTVESAGHSITPLDVRCEIPVGDQFEPCHFSKSQLPDSKATLYLVQHEGYFHRDGLYGDQQGDYEDNASRFVFFCRAVLEAVRLFDLQPELIHVNDWQTGLIPALLAGEYRENQLYKDISTLITIHNLAYQGVFPGEQMSLTGLDPKFFNWQQMEFFGQLNLLKTGIVFADAINTVSPTYAEEIQTEAQGCGLEGVLQHRSDRLFGIINGIDAREWDPSTDPHIAENFDADFSVEQGSAGKAACKLALQTASKLEPNPDAPLIGIVGRLATQKGWSLIIPVMRRWLESMDAQWVILGTGEPDYHHVLTSLHQAHASKLALNLSFSNSLAHQIESGADLFLMPSQYEPCGLNQMYSMAYGTLPLVRHTGGLADTVVNATAETISNGTATGFSFNEYTAESLDEALQRAVEMYQRHRPTWNQIMINGMTQDWSWSSSAKAYDAVYQKAIALHSADTNS